MFQVAQFRANSELKSALDLAGQVYVFGSGTNKQFQQDPSSKLKSINGYQFEYFDKVVEVWKNRISPMQLVDKLSLQRRAEERERKREVGLL